MKKLARWWPFFAIISLIVLVIDTIQTVPYLEGVWYVLVAVTYGLIFLQKNVSKQDTAHWRNVLGIFLILLLLLVGVVYHSYL
ncbi:hypothetical protein [Alkalicoccobacillus gibsonii]|uniref:hypothetical protein n=1 Tax=Alkalicoccobacillus gibsonii TaxID=79881 RepID=UPI0019334B32|nr:hypothetical protein [Alkalicoccobacillus gibsonii]MBM0064556.1 hypothetical protein [Alkalicoccobacillus gibsonii]